MSAAGSLFTVYELVPGLAQGRVIRRVGVAGQSGDLAERAYEAAERYCAGMPYVFDESCPHDTAYALCREAECAEVAA